MSCSAKHRRWVMGNGDNVVGFGPVTVGKQLKYRCSIQEGQSSLYWSTYIDDDHADQTWPLSSQVRARHKKMGLLHEALMETLRTLGDDVSASSELDRKGMDVWNGFLTVLLCCCDISDVKEVSCGKHDIAMTKPV